MKKISLHLSFLFFISSCAQVPVAYTPTQSTTPMQTITLKELFVQVGKTKKADIKNAIGSPDKLIVSDGKETWYYNGKKLGS